MNGNSTIHFSLFELDLKAGELRRNGSRIRLQEQPFQILVSLLERPGEVVTREELQRKLWPSETFVDFDHGLNAAIRRLRDALGDSADTPRFVETVARRGYRFIAPVSRPATATGESTAGVQAGESERGPVISPAPGHRGPKRIILGAVAGILAAGILVFIYFGLRSPVRSVVSQRRLTANRSEVPVLSAALSRSGKHLAFADTTGLYLRQVDSGETHSFSLALGGVANPESWFPDDSHLIVASRDRATARLWRVSVWGGEPYLLADNASAAVVSPDGSEIAFIRGVGTESSEEIWVMQANGEKATKHLRCQSCSLGGLAWSPDGKYLAYVQQQYEMGSFWGFDTELEILNLITDQTQEIKTHVGPALAWTPDDRIIFVQGEPPPNQSDSNLWWLRLNPRTWRPEGVPERLTNGNGLISGMTASADGKRFAILRRTLQPNVYITELGDHGSRLSTPRDLTPDEWYDFPTAWTPDSSSVLFFSDRGGHFQIFKQAIAQTQPELLVGGDQTVALPRLSPEGSWVLYLNSGFQEPHVRAAGAPRRDIAMPQRLMRVPLSGGPPQQVLEGTGINDLQCATAPSSICIYSELSPGEEHFFTFDPLKGKGPEIPGATIRASDFYSFNWSLSPDGKWLAFSNKLGSGGQPGIRLYSLVGSTERHISLSGETGIASLDWAADGQSIWATAFTTSASISGLWTTGFSETGAWTLLNVSLAGKITPMLRETKMNLGWAIPSPDGRKLALWMAEGSSNVWLVESH